MPRTKRGDVSVAINRMQQQARSLLGSLRQEIRAKEAEVKRLREKEAGLARLIGTGAAPARRGGGGGGGGGGASRGRINWRVVLKQMPKQFKASDVRKVRGLKGKRPSEIFAAITRWIEGGMAKRKARGIYERVA
jgi:hypothetical protein